MYKRKKYHGGLKVLLLLLFIMLLNTHSTCYARTRITEDEAKYIWEYLVSNTYQTDIDNGSIYNMYLSSNVNTINRTSNSSYLTFYNFFNSNNTIDFYRIDELIFWCRFNGSSGYQNTFDLFYTNANMGKFDTLPFIYLNFSNNAQSSSNLVITFIDDEKNPVSHTFYGATFLRSTNTFNALNTYNANSTSAYIRLDTWNQNNNNSMALDNIPGIATFTSTNVVYTNFDGSSRYTEPTSRLLISLYDGGIVPTPTPTPTPTITPTPVPTGGGIDYTNQLNNINNSINNQGQAIIDNQNENTEQIVNAINGANENYWGSEENLTGEEQEEQIEESLNEIMDNLEEELTQSEIIQELERSRSRVPRLF